jgi:uncharacterized protein
MRLLSATLALAAVLLAGCSSPVVPLPPIAASPTGLSNPGQIIWHDLATRDLAVSQAFYSQLFGWTFQKIGTGPRQYTLIEHQGKVIGGMFLFDSGESNDPAGEWLVNLSTPDVDAAVLLAEAAGARVIEPARDIPNRGRATFISDDQEALLVLTESSSGDPPTGVVPIGGWLWNELWTHDRAKAEVFYGEVFDYEFSQPADAGNNNYAILSRSGQPLAGLLEIDAPEIRPHWLPFVRVLDVEATVTLAKAMQANVIFEPNPEIRDGKIALLQGPTGEPFVVQSYDFE